MTRHTGPRGRFGSPDCPTADNRSRFRPHGPGASAEGVLREMAFVFHLTRSVRAAMTTPELSTAARLG
jgi:hypothetical protein